MYFPFPPPRKPLATDYEIFEISLLQSNKEILEYVAKLTVGGKTENRPKKTFRQGVVLKSGKKEGGFSYIKPNSRAIGQVAIFLKYNTPKSITFKRQQSVFCHVRSSLMPMLQTPFWTM